MEFRFGEKEEKLRDEVRKFVKAEMPPYHIGKQFEEETSAEGWAFSMAISKKLAEKKWLTMSWPEEYGGMGASHWERVVFSEEAAYWGIPGLGMGRQLIKTNLLSLQYFPFSRYNKQLNYP